MTDDEIYLQEQANSISTLSPKLLDPEITIDYDKIDEIYHMHESDEIGGILKPFMVDFLPKFKSYQIPEGIFRLHKLFLET